MLHFFALFLLTPTSHARAVVTNATLFDFDLHDNVQNLAKIKNLAFEVASNGTAHSDGLDILKELIPDLDDEHTNLTRTQTDAIVDIVFRTPLIVNQTECQAYKNLPLKTCGRSNHTENEQLSELVRGLQAGCEHGLSALMGYVVEGGIRACFDVNLATNSSCVQNTIGCLRGLRGTDMRISTQIQEVLQGHALTKRSQHTSALGLHDVSNSTDVVLYKRATPPKELINARKTAQWTGIVTILGIVAAIITFFLGLWLGFPVGAMAIAFTVLGLIGAASGASSQLAVSRELGKAVKDIQGRKDISNTTVVAPVKPGYCSVFPSFKACQ
ncbi:hypothetical protein CVIRNUC_003467 [Coccomyxa viridis]|uniref:Uncharacterized protein n=1 Tax=Coccomyxa viridis TaxID=1274662 RepID=A0AAV1I0N5_9CHLO|nr:hypothetical protein CVIRNUC_003467 [Coccomyxa viridis]